MRSNRVPELRQAVLRELRDCEGHLMPEQALLNALRLSLAPPPIGTEFRAAIDFLEGMGWIRGVRPDIGGDVRWTITDLGKAQLDN